MEHNIAKGFKMASAIRKLIDADSSYSFGQVAKALGVNVSTVWRWALSEKLPSIKVGGRRYVSSADLQEFVERCNSEHQPTVVTRSPLARAKASSKAASELERSGW